jgi:hypothetical protein
VSEDVYYGTVYVYARCPAHGVAAVLARALGGSAAPYDRVTGMGLDLSVLRNDDYDERRAAAGAGDFLHFPYRVEVAAADPAEEPDPVAVSVRLLDGLRAAGFDYVMACGYEDDLPRRGRSRDYTW